MNQRSKDLFKGLRSAYNLFIQFLSHNNIVSVILSGSPAYYIIFFVIYQNSIYPNNPAIYYLSQYAYTIMGILLVFWLLASISIWRVLPNLLTISIFIYTCIGHWCLISGFIMVFYGWSQLPYYYTSYLLSGLLPSILLLLISGDIMRGVKKRFYGLLETPLAITGATATVDTGAVNTGSVNPFTKEGV